MIIILSIIHMLHKNSTLLSGLVHFNVNQHKKLQIMFQCQIISSIKSVCKLPWAYSLLWPTLEQTLRKYSPGSANIPPAIPSKKHIPGCAPVCSVYISIVHGVITWYIHEYIPIRTFMMIPIIEFVAQLTWWLGWPDSLSSGLFHVSS